MLIAIDASRATARQKTGTEYYSQEIICEIAKIDKENSYILYSKEPPEGKLNSLPKNFSWKVMPFPRWWSQIRLSWEMLWHRPDILFVPAHTIPIIHPQKTLVAIHDLGFLKSDYLYAPYELSYHRWALGWARKHAAKIITISEYSKNDLINLAGIPAEKIVITPLAYDKNLYNLDKPKSWPEKIKECQPFIFTVGRLEEKKNTLGLIKAFAILRQDKKIKHHLVLAGKPGYNYDKILAYKKSLATEIQQDIIELGYTSEEELALWMKAAALFCFPSFFEGFGIPLLEAMACGTPVVAANTTAIPEVVDEAGLLVNPQLSEEIARALSKIIINPALRRSLINKGLTRCQQFSWPKTAEKTLDVIKNE